MSSPIVSDTREDIPPTLMLESFREIMELKSIGKLLTDVSDDGVTIEMLGAELGEEGLDLFEKAGGVLTDRTDDKGRTARDYAAKNGPDAVAAYDTAVERQGGLRHVEPNPAP